MDGNLRVTGLWPVLTSSQISYAATVSVKGSNWDIWFLLFDVNKSRIQWFQFHLNFKFMSSLPYNKAWFCLILNTSNSRSVQKQYHHTNIAFASKAKILTKYQIKLVHTCIKWKLCNKLASQQLYRTTSTNY